MPEDSAYILELVAGLCFIAAGAALLRFYARTREPPERLLGITFLLMGVSYLFYEIPFASEDADLLIPLSVCGRLTWDASIATTAVFTRHVFHPRQAWPSVLLWTSLGSIGAGILVSIAYGDWAGLAPLTNPGFWIEWAGQLIPFAWVASVAFTEFGRSRRRMRFGLSDAMVCNRFLLFGMFGLIQFATVLLVAPMYMDMESGAIFSSAMDAVLGSLEIATVLVIGLAFFPPGWYRRWIEAATPERGAAEAGS